MTRNITILDREDERNVMLPDVGALRNLVIQMLRRREQETLAFVAGENLSAVVTRIIAPLSDALGCSESTVWSTLLRLKRRGLIDFGDAMSKGKPLQLTGLGELIVGGGEL